MDHLRLNSSALSALVSFFCLYYTGISGWILRRSCFAVLARLSYQVYLVHPSLLLLRELSAVRFPVWSLTRFLFLWCGATTMSFVIAGANYMIMEQPLLT